MNKFVVTNDNFTQIVADADNYLDVVKDSAEYGSCKTALEHIEKLLSVIDFLLEVDI